MATITDILISELDPALLPAKGTDELVINQLDETSGKFVTRRITWKGVGESIRDLAGDPDDPSYEGVQQILFADGTEVEPSITFKSDTSTGIFKPQLPTATVAITSNGAEVLRATTVGIKKSVGIGLKLNEAPADALHVKNGGAVFEFGINNKIHLSSKNGEPSINTVDETPLNFGTKNITRGRFSKTGAFEIYGALGVGMYNGGVPSVSHGVDGYTLLSQGDDKNPEWTSPYDFFNDNKTILQNLLLTGGSQNFLFYELPPLP